MDGMRTRDLRLARPVKVGLLALIFAFAATLIACTGPEADFNDNSSNRPASPAIEMSADQSAAGASVGSDAGDVRVDGRTRQADVGLSATDVVEVGNAVVAKAKELGGFSQSESYSSSDFGPPRPLEGRDGDAVESYTAIADAHLMVRVPDSELDEYLGYLATLGDVRYQHLSENDVKIEQARFKARVSVLEEEEAALSKIFEEAVTVEDMMSVRTRLLEVRTDLATATAQVDDIMAADAYSTVAINITLPPEYRDPSEVTFAGFSVYRLKQAAATGVDSLFELIYFTVGALIALSPWIALVVIIALIARWRIRASKAKRAEQQRPFDGGPPDDGAVMTTTTTESHMKGTPVAPDGIDDTRV